MKRSLLLSASVASVALAAPALAQPPTPAPLPALAAPEAPGGSDSASPRPAAGAPTAAPPRLTPQQVYERIRRGIVAIERNGVPLALGTVLDGDGRILTSLSGLGGGDTADVRYADGSTAHVKVGSGDKANDLALLVPPSNRWLDGLTASESDPVGAPLRAILPSRGTRLGPADADVKGWVDAHARDGGPLGSMLDVDVKGPLVAGAPLLDSTGSVVGVLVRACKGTLPQPRQDAMPWASWATAQDQQAKPSAAPCTAAVLGAPVAAIRTFLSKTPATAAVPTPWLGIQGEKTGEGAVHGVRVVAVAPASPAQKAGLRPTADVIVAADGHPIDTPEALGSAIGKHAAGETVTLLVFGDDRFREVPVALRQAP